jgi:hypothetical protein
MSGLIIKMKVLGTVGAQAVDRICTERGWDANSLSLRRVYRGRFQIRKSAVRKVDILASGARYHRFDENHRIPKGLSASSLNSRGMAFRLPY